LTGTASVPSECPGLILASLSTGIVVDNTVLDCTSYVLRHPGGQQIIHGFGGQDASWQWFTFHDRKTWNDIASTLRVGRTEGVENRHVKPKAFVGLRGFGYQDD
jgi:cytochrome b involved in lipid metabolism